MNPAYIQSLVRKVLREEGLLPAPAPIVVIGPNCEPRVLEDA